MSADALMKGKNRRRADLTIVRRKAGGTYHRIAMFLKVSISWFSLGLQVNGIWESPEWASETSVVERIEETDCVFLQAHARFSARIDEIKCIDKQVIDEWGAWTKINAIRRGQPRRAPANKREVVLFKNALTTSVQN